MTDLEKGPLLQKTKQAELVAELKKEPVGGTPGNPMFWVYLQLAVRGTIFSCLLATLVWVPATGDIGDGAFRRFKPFIALAICIFIFTINPIFGQVVDNATAGIQGTFVACLNIFILRGFFAEGVQPGEGHFSTVSIVGWVDLAIFNLLCLIMNVRMAFRMFAMANNTGFMLMFLNPADQTPFSKNFKINPNGTAVSSFLGVALGSVLAIIAMLLPYPWRFAFADMKANATKVSADTCKLFSAAVDYFKGDTASVLINQNLAQAAVLKAEIGGMGGSIGAAYNECWDVGNAGTVRNLMTAHSGLLGQTYDILHSVLIALSTEDFGPSHKQVMKDIGATAMDFVEKTNLLLMEVTKSAGDGEIDEAEKQGLQALVKDVQAAMKALSSKFDASRRTFQKPVCQELLSESFFVFALSAYGRLIIQYTDMMCTNPPIGASFGSVLVGGIKGMFSFPSTHHDRFTLRYWLGLMLCFVFSVAMDNYGGACAITAVFLLNTRVGPDMMATLNTLLAVVVGSVAGAILYSYSCFTGQGHVVLPIACCLYWVVTIHIGYSGSSFGLIGLLMAALAPFVLVKECPSGVPDDTGGATGLWIGIRGCILAMVIISICEILSVPGAQGDLAFQEFDAAMQKLKEAFGALWKSEDPSAALAPVDGLIASSSNFNSGAKMEPRYWKCKWKAGFMDECNAVATKLRLDVLTIKHAIDGSGKYGGTGVLNVLNGVPAIDKMAKDLASTMEDAREIAIEMLDHGYGPFAGMSKLDSLEGIDSLDGFDKAIEDVSASVKFPAAAPDSMEDDQLCQLSIIFVMLDYSIKHVADMIKAAIRNA